jgi:DNA polymerase III delta prime subunit
VVNRYRQYKYEIGIESTILINNKLKGDREDKMKEVELLENKEKREKMIDRIDILDKVGTLLLLPSTELATRSQVAKYYGVDESAIRKIEVRNSDEIESDGFKLYTRKEIENLLNGQEGRLEKNSRVTMIYAVNNECIKVANRGLVLYTKRAVLRIGMLLRESPVAKEIRTRLLDIVHDVEKEKPQIINNIVSEIRTEQNIMQEMMEAMFEGDYDKESRLKTELLGLKTKRVKELEQINKTITENALTIKDTRLVINRIARYIAGRRYYGNYKACWDRIWTMANYKLHMNVRNRDKKGKTYIIDTLTNDELKQLELMMRNWCVELHYNLEAVLKL